MDIPVWAVVQPLMPVLQFEVRFLMLEEGQQGQEVRRKNVRTAWILVGIALLVMLSSVPFWQQLFKIASDAAK